MRAEVSCLFRLKQSVGEAQIGGGVRLQDIVSGRNWRKELYESGDTQGKELLRACEKLTWGGRSGYNYRFYVALDVVNDQAPIIRQSQESIARAIVLSRIVRPISIATGGPWIESFYPDSGKSHHRVDILPYYKAYPSRSYSEPIFTLNDLKRIAELWEPLQRLFNNHKRHERTIRALKYFDGGYHMWYPEFRHIIFHAALESLICVGRDLNKAQITQRLPRLVPEITEKQASAIYELCCDFKHAAAPLNLVTSEGASNDQERYEATEWLEQALRCLFQKALTEPSFADLLADRGELARRYPVSSPKSKKSSIGNLIVREPNIREGRPIIAGTGVTVRRIVGWYKLGLSPEEIADRIGHLSLSQVYAALTYYHANKDELDTDIAAEEAEADRLEQEHLLASQGRS